MKKKNYSKKKTKKKQILSYFTLSLIWNGNSLICSVSSTVSDVFKHYWNTHKFPGLGLKLLQMMVEPTSMHVLSLFNMMNLLSLRHDEIFRKSAFKDKDISWTLSTG